MDARWRPGRARRQQWGLAGPAGRPACAAAGARAPRAAAAAARAAAGSGARAASHSLRPTQPPLRPRAPSPRPSPQAAAPLLPQRLRRATPRPRPRCAPARAAPDGGPPTPQQPPRPNKPPTQQQKAQPGGGGGNGVGDGEPGGGGGGPPELPPAARRLVALLVEYGGVYGSAACLLGFFLHLDPFGGFHWDAADAALGVQLYAPLLAFDALVMLPDYSAREDQADQISRLFFGPGVVAAAASVAAGEGADKEGEGSGKGDGKDGKEGGAQAAAKAPAPPPPAPANEEPPLLLRLQVALELLQSFQTRANPGIGLTLPQEALVGAVGSLADEMLYRAVALTFLGGWIT
jgi:hypothetical protein